MLLNNRKNRRQEPSMASGTLNLMMLEFAPEWEAAKANLSRLDAIMERIFSLPSCGYPGASQGGAAEEGSMAAAGFIAWRNIRIFPLHLAGCCGRQLCMTVRWQVRSL